jgi:SAM-dependent methyltransferase
MAELYGTRAELYDFVYAFKDYAAEARQVEDRLSALGISPGSTLLEGAMGTGGHAVYLARRYTYAGFDVSPEMVGVARQKLPEATLFVADLRSFAVERPVDAFVCLFSSIGYLLDATALFACAAAAARAVRAGGGAIVEPWFTRSEWEPGRPTLQTYDGVDLKIARASMSGVEPGEVATTDMAYVVARRGQPVETFTERHRLWLAPTETLVAAFDKAGFDTQFESGGLTGRGLLVGVRR